MLSGMFIGLIHCVTSSVESFSYVMAKTIYNFGEGICLFCIRSTCQVGFLKFIVRAREQNIPPLVDTSVPFVQYLDFEPTRLCT